MTLFNLDLIPIIGFVGIVSLIVGFSLRDYKIGLALMLVGMMLVLGTILLKIYIATHQ